MMGGRIGLQSAPGEGSTFYFTAELGLAEEPPPAASPSETPQRAARRCAAGAGGELKAVRVLVVDDNRTNRLVLGKMLENWRMQPACAASGPQALDRMQQATHEGRPFAVVLLDACMPGMDGFSLAERIRASGEFADATIIMLPSAAHRGDAERCRELGIAAYLIKPISQSRLFDAIVTAMGAPDGRGEGGGEAAGERPRRPRRALRVLLAEDNAVNQKLAVRMLEKWGHRVTVAATGREVLRRVGGERFDLVLMDVQMPEMDGLEATAAIRKAEATTGTHLPIVAMTAHAMKGDRERCLDAGMDGYIAKPIQAAELRAAVEEAAEAERTQTDGPAAPPAAPQAAGEAEGQARSEGAAFDPAAASARFDGDEGLIREVAELFLAEHENAMAEVREAVAAGEAERLERAAHSLKGSVGNFGAKAAFDAALALEVMGRRGKLDGAEAACERLAGELARLVPELRAFAGLAAPSAAGDGRG
jgi:CheY-like chemotaxis protein/HPt (histidine-containing phosphotransfer) domain-containing protein